MQAAQCPLSQIAGEIALLYVKVNPCRSQFTTTELACKKTTFVNVPFLLKKKSTLYAKRYDLHPQNSRIVLTM